MVVGATIEMRFNAFRELGDLSLCRSVSAGEMEGSLAANRDLLRSLQIVVMAKGARVIVPVMLTYLGALPACAIEPSRVQPVSATFVGALSVPGKDASSLRLRLTP